ncbi:TPA: shufflon system plasmid conjugative transfer pilus tip adhesin PilV [Burkholderia cenocepacia]|uniref:shufflon system plasmid conjugative transfer pilus tip adhesin PilV n=1 Tax=Burkholderia cepacia complex TaxID=87882 RepID=UPI0021091DAA|nr:MULTISPECIES: shufflon system plasmid conjugative transfer pilus tip adhesin PilV [Burkholderia cepacia complex]MCQ4564179.1 shufflon system plasmid conjugative transfer pilus tip adhesin PilV [Burkholderia contaminans]MCW3504543.1 shufflon system plasmid conjugative transfer pilus tip adhesin PilV [Burkholderia cenocepacia]MCW3512005.1 shufflon system plasmid conjugative transfer pilus tip adhesin PilV [Burkholderia cenocepacia]MCW3519662.1 shufflon system plasmid conjugative transfer pilus
MEAILGIIVSLALSAMSVAGLLAWSAEGAANVTTAVAAGQVRRINSAAEQYVKDFGATLIQQATAGAPLLITIDMLKNAGYLSQGISSTNAFRQTWVIQVRQPLPGQLQALVTAEGGDTIEPTQLVQVAAQAGAQGGFVPYPRQFGDASMDPGTAVGTHGGWRVALAGYRNPGSGRLASLLTFGGTAGSGNGYLYRVSVPNRPDLNEMQTALGMRGNDINNVGTVNGNRARFSGRIATNGLNPDDLPAGWGGGLRTGDVYAAGTIAAGNGGATPAGMNVNGDMWADRLTFNTAATCSWNQITVRDNNQAFICNRMGGWVPMSNLVGNLTTTGQYAGYYNGWGVTPPACGPGGNAWFSITPVTTAVEFANHNPPISGVVYQMGWNGSQWILQIYNVLADGNRTRINDELGLQADIRVGCSFANGA